MICLGRVKEQELAASCPEAMVRMKDA